MDLTSLLRAALVGIATEAVTRTVTQAVLQRRERRAIMKNRYYLDTLSLALAGRGTSEFPATEAEAEGHELWGKSLRHGTFGPPSSDAWDYLFSDADELLRIDLGAELRRLRRMTLRLPFVDSGRLLFFLRAVEHQCERTRVVVWHRKIRAIRTRRDARRWARTATRQEVAELALYASRLLRENDP